mmetsp:Transcript_2569/g.7402  ORF Transcript_2569/g.7402 Transcript_2569/m.7402 type:complete len:227 (-) Transcript_2569:222-902(-)
MVRRRRGPRGAEGAEPRQGRGILRLRAALRRRARRGRLPARVGRRVFAGRRGPGGRLRGRAAQRAPLRALPDGRCPRTEGRRRAPGRGPAPDPDERRAAAGPLGRAPRRAAVRARARRLDRFEGEPAADDRAHAAQAHHDGAQRARGARRRRAGLARDRRRPLPQGHRGLKGGPARARAVGRAARGPRRLLPEPLGRRRREAPRPAARELRPLVPGQRGPESTDIC